MQLLSFLISLFTATGMLQLPVSKPVKTIHGKYYFYAVKTTEEFSTDNIHGFRSLAIPETTHVHMLRFSADHQFIQHQSGTDANSIYAFENRGKYFVAKGTWSIRQDTLRLEYTEETAYENQEMNAAQVVKKYDLVQLIPAANKRTDQYLFGPNHTICFIGEHGLSNYCLKKNDRPKPPELYPDIVQTNTTNE